MTKDLLQRLSGSKAIPPVPQTISAATAAGTNAANLSEHWLDLRGHRAEDNVARSIAEGLPLSAALTITAAITAAVANLTLDFQLRAYPRNTPLTALTFLDAAVNTGTDTITIAGHLLSNGTLVTLSNGGGALPTGLAASTHYYVINATTNTFQLSLTPDGAAVDITAAAGGGTHSVTFHPTILAASGPVPSARLAAGRRVQIVTNPLWESPRMPRHPFLFAFWLPSANLTGGAVLCDIGDMPDVQVQYPSGVTT